jgi:surface antigen
MQMQNTARKVVVFASFVLAGIGSTLSSAQAHTRKSELHLASAHHHGSSKVAHVSSKTRLAHSGRSHHGSALALNGYSREGHADRQRVTLIVHRHGRTYIRTVWRPRNNWRALADNVYSSGGYNGGWLECVPYARRVSGIQLTGDAYTWWDEAAGRYGRGHQPEGGSVLNFRNNGRMRLGHVAVVTEVVNRREVLVTQANWGGPGFTRGGVSTGISVVDVSPNNDWTAVRMALGHSATYGSVYPTYGFIYGHQSAPTTQLADASGPAPQILTDRPPADLRSPRERGRVTVTFGNGIQLASAPSFDGPAIADSAPDRALR